MNLHHAEKFRANQFRLTWWIDARWLIEREGFSVSLDSDTPSTFSKFVASREAVSGKRREPPASLEDAAFWEDILGYRLIPSEVSEIKMNLVRFARLLVNQAKRIQDAPKFTQCARLEGEQLQ